jgi:F-type H+-transporting ATPase subunit b
MSLRALRGCLCALALLSGASTALAAGGGGGAGPHEVNWKELGFSFFNFAVFLGGLVYLLRRPMRDFLANRRSTLEDSLREAARLRSEAEARLRDLEGRLADLDAERKKILAQYQREGEAEKERLVENARRAAEAMRRELKFRLEQEARELQKELRHRAVDAALAMAERIVRAQVAAADRRRFADDYIEQIKTAPPPTAFSE